VDKHAIRRQIRQLLNEHGPLHLSQLADLLWAGDDHIPDPVDAGGKVDLDALNLVVFGIGDDELDIHVDWVPHRLDDGRLCDLEVVLEDLTLTHVLTSGEVADGVLDLEPDLDPLLIAFDDDDIPLSGSGTLLTIELDERGDLVVESDASGWFPGSAGDMLVVRVHDGGVTFDLADAATLESPSLARDAERVAEVHELITNPVDSGELVVEVRARYPRFLSAPSAPLGVLMAAAGLEERDDVVRRVDDEADDDLVDHLELDHGLDPATIADLFLLDRELNTMTSMALRIQVGEWLDDAMGDEREALEQLVAELDEAPEPTLPMEGMRGLVARVMGDDQAASAFVEDFLADGGLPIAGAMEAVGKDLDRELKDRIARSNLRWVVARCMEVRGETTSAEQWLRRALAADRGHGGATFDLAVYLDDRGQAGAALSLLNEVGAGKAAPAWHAQLQEFAKPGPATVGRNESCGCGSGRKHKTCCGPHNGWPLTARTPWLWDKLVRFANRQPQADDLEELGGYVGPRSGEVGALVLIAAALHEDGMIGSFIEDRGRLLPADELAVLQQWRGVRAGLYEVVEVDPGESMELLDLRGGDRHLVTERTATQELSVGQTILAWLHPYPDGTLRIGVGLVPVGLQQRQMWLDILDSDEVGPEDVMIGCARMWAPPGLQNTDGEPLVMCIRTLKVGDPDEARAGLDTEFDEAGDDAWVLYAETANGPTPDTIVATIRVDEGLVIIETNSVERMDRYAVQVEEVLGDVEVVDEHRIPASEIVRRMGDDSDDDEWDEDWDDAEDGDDDGDDPGWSHDELGPEQQAAMDEAVTGYMDQYEERWCDISVPVLGGMTPRQAAEDPTRRPDLEALLAEMDTEPEWTGPGRGMSAARLRSLLGLE